MARRMSCSLTVDAVRDRSKTVTRRRLGTWRNLHAGDQLVLVEKAMGLPAGARQVVLATVEVVSVRDEPLAAVLDDPTGMQAEGLPHLRHSEFITFWLVSHGYPADADPESVLLRRIEWEYLD